MRSEGLDLYRGSFTGDPGGLDDRPPFVDLRLLERAEGFRGLLVARCDPLTKVGKPLAARGRRPKALTTAALSLLITSLGVSLGAHMPVQTEA